MIQLRLFNEETCGHERVGQCPRCGVLLTVDEYDPFLKAVSSAYRDCGGRVFPKHIAPIVGYSEQHTREIMSRLAQTGKLQRIGRRGGYVPVYAA